MKNWYRSSAMFLLAVVFFSCDKKADDNFPEPNFDLISTRLDNRSLSVEYRNVPASPTFRIRFSAPVNRSLVEDNINILLPNGTEIPLQYSYESGDSVVVVQTTAPLQYLARYRLAVLDNFASTTGVRLKAAVVTQFLTTFDNSDKFPRISDSALADLVQQQTFKYFWDFGHPVSGLARERNNSGDLVTSGGSGFGIMAIITGIHRNFITRADGLTRVQKIVSFLKNNTQKFHGAFPHWLNGNTGNVIPFSALDNGADLVETSYLVMGLLTVRQYFSGTSAAEINLRNDINSIWQGVEWSFFRKNNENVLYWHWSPSNQFNINMQIKGWNESLITYVLAVSSPTYSIPKAVYDNGWASNGGMKNGNAYLGYPLPLGPAFGGPLFFAHYSFMGINPTQLTDTYANYWTQNKNHTLINYTYCVNNPLQFVGYSDSCWGLTASDDLNGYRVHSPTSDNGVISPTAALSSFPYTPNESMKAMKFFYYKLGDKLWGQYGFYDAFSIHDAWFASSTLAIDQGPIVVMMENYRSGLLWNLFMSCPEVKAGMTMLGFQSPFL